jgi:hypothetical protein
MFKLCEVLAKRAERIEQIKIAQDKAKENNGKK